MPSQSTNELHPLAMLLQPTLNRHRPHGPAVPTLRTARLRFAPAFVTCSSSTSHHSLVHNYNTVDYEKRPPLNWNSVYRKISFASESEEASAGAGPGGVSSTAAVLSRCDGEGKKKKLTKWELCRVVKELRKFKRFRPALEVYDWMSDRDQRFRLSESDAAIQLDLIAKVFGVSAAEDFYRKLSDQLKDRRVYGALLNAYVRGRMKEKAESLMGDIRDKGYALNSLPFNVMMTLYMNLKDYDKVELLVSEMIEQNIQLDIYSYNIWLSSRGSLGSIEKMEEVFEQMKLDRRINPNWTTFSTLATLYFQMGEPAKAEDCLKKIETRITGRDRKPYHYLISLYGTVGKKEETYRIWNIYKAAFPSIPNLGYHAMVSSLVRVGDIEGAEEVYKEWLSVRTFLDPRIGNLLMGFYVKEGDTGKAEIILDQMIELGGKPTASTWEILAEGHIGERRISEASSCFEKAFSSERLRSWKPKPMNLTSFFKLCEEEGDFLKKEALIGLLRQSNFLKNRHYASLVGFPSSYSDIPEGDRVGDILPNDDDSDDGGDMLMNQFQGTGM